MKQSLNQRSAGTNREIHRKKMAYVLFIYSYRSISSTWISSDCRAPVRAGATPVRQSAGTIRFDSLIIVAMSIQRNIRISFSSSSYVFSWHIYLWVLLYFLFWYSFLLWTYFCYVIIPYVSNKGFFSLCIRPTRVSSQGNRHKPTKSFNSVCVCVIPSTAPAWELWTKASSPERRLCQAVGHII